MPEVFLTKEELQDLPEIIYPAPAVTDNLRAFLGWGIKAHTHGFYSHFIWLLGAGTVASQGLLGFRREKLSSYTGGYRIKVFDLYSLTAEEKGIISQAIHKELALPWYKNMYDVLAYPGQLLGLHWLQIPGMEICSDKLKYLKLVRPEYDLKFPDPQQCNVWLTEHPEIARVAGRYTPD
jgi:hypothetical protein